MLTTDSLNEDTPDHGIYCLRTLDALDCGFDFEFVDAGYCRQENRQSLCPDARREEWRSVPPVRRTDLLRSSNAPA